MDAALEKQRIAIARAYDELYQIARATGGTPAQADASAAAVLALHIRSAISNARLNHGHADRAPQVPRPRRVDQH